MKYFDYDDINLIPKKCIVNSRSECNIITKFGSHYFRLPVVPANMKSVIDEKLAIDLANNGFFYIMHRFDININDFINTMKKRGLLSSISIGVNEDTYQLIDEICSTTLIPDYITIDIAHGHSIKMEKMIKYVKAALPKTFIIAGNISTREAARDLIEWGADAIKVGIGPGSVCSTYPETGFGSRGIQASVIQEIADISTVPIIADGGIKNPSDVA